MSPELSPALPRKSAGLLSLCCKPARGRSSPLPLLLPGPVLPSCPGKGWSQISPPTDIVFNLVLAHRQVSLQVWAFSHVDRVWVLPKLSYSGKMRSCSFSFSLAGVNFPRKPWGFESPVSYVSACHSCSWNPTFLIGVYFL